MAMDRVQLRHGALLWLVARHCALLFRSRQLGGCCGCRLPVCTRLTGSSVVPSVNADPIFSQEPTLPQDQVGVSWEWCRLHLSASSTWLLHDFLAPKQKLGTIKSLIGLTTDQALDRTQFCSTSAVLMQPKWFGCRCNSSHDWRSGIHSLYLGREDWVATPGRTTAPKWDGHGSGPAASRRIAMTCSAPLRTAVSFSSAGWLCDCRLPVARG